MSKFAFVSGARPRRGQTKSNELGLGSLQTFWRGPANPPPAWELAQPYAVRDQGTEVPCCVSHAITITLEILLARLNLLSEPLSVLYHYWYARGGSRPAPGSTLPGLDTRDAMVTAARQGLAVDTLHPPRLPTDPAGETAVIDRRAAELPPDAIADANAAGRRFRVRAPGGQPTTRLLGSDPQEWRRAVAGGLPILWTFRTCGTYFDFLNGGAGGVLDVATNLHADNYHCVAVVGYAEHDGQSWFRLADSRGTTIGDRGRWRVRSDVVQSLHVTAHCLTNLSLEGA